MKGKNNKVSKNNKASKGSKPNKGGKQGATAPKRKGRFRVFVDWVKRRKILLSLIGMSMLATVLLCVAICDRVMPTTTDDSEWHVVQSAYVLTKLWGNPMVTDTIYMDSIVGVYELYDDAAKDFIDRHRAQGIVMSIPDWPKVDTVYEHHINYVSDAKE